MKHNTIDYRWSEEKIQDWYENLPWLVGCNFIPSTAVNQLEMWQAETFDVQTIEQELTWAANIGMNTIRVFLHDIAWLEEREGFKVRIDKFLQIAYSKGIRTMFVFFDDCWWPGAQSGLQPQPIAGVHNSQWLQSPGSNYLKINYLKEYVQDIVRTFADDPRILVWDIYNEIGNSFLTVGSLPGYKKWHKMAYRALKHLLLGPSSLPLLLNTAAWIREINPSQPITAGVWFGSKKLNQKLIEVSDIVSFHNYFKVKNFENHILKLKKYNRPILCTEYMSRTSGSLFETHLPILKKYNVGAYNWGLVSGKTQTIYSWSDQPNTPEPQLWFHDIFHTDGRPYSQKEVDFIRDITSVRTDR